MPKGPIRRAQLIVPFGVGAMVVVRDGTCLISAGLDHWFESEYEEAGGASVDRDEYRTEEWRLSRVLGVDHFMLPPDYRTRRRHEEVPNVSLTVPFLRFPQWHFCPSCYSLHKRPLSVRHKNIKCPNCERKRRTNYLAQVQFVAICDHGHVQDFPWREWVHRSLDPGCDEPMCLIPTGGSTLADQKVVCECGKQRTLGRIMESSVDGTRSFLSHELEPGGSPYLCRGYRPWLGTEEPSACGRPLRGSLRSASNVYFAQVRSAIYLPCGTADVPSELVSMLQEPPLSTIIKVAADTGVTLEPRHLRNHYPRLLERYEDAQIASGIDLVLGGGDTKQGDVDNGLPGDDQETAFRREEYRVLREPRDEDLLVVQAANLEEYDAEIARFFSRVMLVNRLRETRALVGFTRVYPDNQQTLDQRKDLMWRHRPSGRQSWLPAYVVFGEGIFIEFDEALLAEWEKREDVLGRLAPLRKRYNKVHGAKRIVLRALTPRLVLVHTFGHLLINRLTYECGYSSAALRERLYVSDNPRGLMAGVLIYTAAGDAEGTLGGLVRMGKADFLEPVVRRAVESARWCSADPVCMEMGDRGGQGPDGLNLAACHNCALVPETACEEFNRLLDRGLVVGKLDNQAMGFFSL